MAFGTRVRFETLRSVAFGSITGSYAAVGSAATDHIRQVCFTNLTDANMLISLDGTNNNIIVPANGFKLLDFTTNKVQDDGFFMDVGTTFYIKYVSAPSSGTFYIETIYASGGV
jgi:hypothetical protein